MNNPPEQMNPQPCSPQQFSYLTASSEMNDAGSGQRPFDSIYLSQWLFGVEDALLRIFCHGDGNLLCGFKVIVDIS
jgi:hypothetical protein